VALTITAVILLPLVLEDEPPPAGPLEVHMPSRAAPPAAEANKLEYAPPPANATVEPPDSGQGEARAGRDEAVPAPAPAQPARAAAAGKEPPETPASTRQPAHAPAAASAVAQYAIQIGVFADKANVERLESRIAALGMKSYTDQVGDKMRIRVGSFQSRAEADKAASRLQDAGIQAKVVER
jgi:DedD protein